MARREYSLNAELKFAVVSVSDDIASFCLLICLTDLRRKNILNTKTGALCHEVNEESH